MSQEIFNSTNKLMLHQFVQNKFVQEFVILSLLFPKYKFTRHLNISLIGNYEISTNFEILDYI